MMVQDSRMPGSESSFDRETMNDLERGYAGPRTRNSVSFCRTKWSGPVKSDCGTVRLMLRATLVASALSTSCSRTPELTIDDPTKPSCPACKIQFDPILTLGRESDPVIPSQSSQVTIDSRGQFYVDRVNTPEVIAVYRADGTFDRVLGRAGQGPGEYAGLWGVVVGPGDTLHALESRGRHTALLPNGTAIRTRQIPEVSPHFIVLSDGSLVVAPTLTKTLSRGQPVHIISPAGEVLSFGNPEQAAFTPETALLFSASWPLQGTATYGRPHG